MKSSVVADDVYDSDIYEDEDSRIEIYVYLSTRIEPYITSLKLSTRRRVWQRQKIYT